jgi:hypothetical protein
METSTALELELLAELRAALTEHDITSEIRESVSALAVTTGTPDVCMVNNIPGAARRIATHVRGLHILEGGE